MKSQKPCSPRSWPVLLLALVSALAAGLAKARPLREPVWLMLAGGLLILPLASKAGACWNYLLPLYAALVAAAACWAAQALAAGRDWQPLVPVGIAALALALATTQTFPLPTTFDETAARTFYGFVQTFHRKLGGPFLVSRPELVNFLVGQNSEIEGYGFAHLASHNAPAARDVLASLEQAHHTLVVETWPLPQRPEWQSALCRNLRPLGACRLGSYFTGYDARLYARRGLPVEFTPPAGVRCLAVPRKAPPAPCSPPMRRLGRFTPATKNACPSINSTSSWFTSISSAVRMWHKPSTPCAQ